MVQDGGAFVRGAIFGDLLTLRLEVREAAGRKLTSILKGKLSSLIR